MVDWLEATPVYTVKYVMQESPDRQVDCRSYYA